ncbi:MAG: YggT family protein [Firmicutes bacterium]|nr:YggT family protein [Bacillota bacterium]
MNWLRLGLEILLFLLVVRVFMDFIPSLGETGFGRALVRLTNPILAPLQRYLPRIAMGDVEVDVSALVVVLLLNLVLNLIF